VYVDQNRELAKRSDSTPVGRSAEGLFCLTKVVRVSK
jgi:hypothetical protein